MLLRASYILLALVVWCCSRRNVVTSLACHSPNVNQDTWCVASSQSRAKRESDPASVGFDEFDDKSYVGTIPNSKERDREKSRTGNRLEGSMPIIMARNPEDIAGPELLINCVNGRKKNQRYSSSFVGNMTSDEPNVDGELDEVAGNGGKARRRSNVQIGEDITLCWIETTTIKEDKTARPPKRLVIREYTISFENSAIIPDRYLECKRLKGELAPDDPEIGKTAPFEIIDEDTKVSRIVNFTTVNHHGDVVVWMHKRVKCGVGSVVSKIVTEWSDDAKENPRKRTEIKVSPQMHRLTATRTEEEQTTDSSSEETPSTQETESAATVSTVTQIFVEIPTSTDNAEAISNKAVSGEKVSLAGSSEEDILTSTVGVQNTREEVSTAVPKTIDYDHSVIAISETTTATDHDGSEMEYGERSSESTEESGVFTTAGQTDSPVGFTEFTNRESEKSAEIFDELSESSVETLTTEPSVIPGEVSSAEDQVEEQIAKTTLGSKVESTGEGELIPMSSTVASLPKITPSASPSETNDYSCESSKGCVGSSEDCDGTGNCSGLMSESSEKEATDGQGDTLPTTEVEIRSFATGSQTSEIPAGIQRATESVATTTQLTSPQSENNTTVIDDAPTTVEPGRNTTLLSTTTPYHKLILSIKVLVDHVNEKQEKRNLVEIDKRLLLNENLGADEHRNLFERLKSLNNSVNVETVSALLNCDGCLNDLMKDSVGEQSANVIDTSLGESESAYTPYSIPPQLSSDLADVEQSYPQSYEEQEITSSTTTSSYNKEDTTEPAHAEREGNPPLKSKIAEKMELVRETLAGIKKDVSTGLQHVMSHLKHDNSSFIDKTGGMIKSKLLNVIADPKDGRIHSKRRRAATEEVSHWSNERVGKAPMGGELRSFIEFALYEILS